MIWLAAAAISACAWIALLFARGGFWRVRTVLDRTEAPVRATWPRVAAVVPARNEAAVLGRCLAALAAQDYPGPFGIVVIDDDSTDDTSTVARRALPRGRGLVLRGGAPPPGWTGKLWALDRGVRKAGETGGEPVYLWFTDADVLHPPDTLRRLVAKAEREPADLVSLMVLLRCRTAWERLLIPAFVFFFRKLYPFRWVNDPCARSAAAAGGCMIVRRAALERAGGLGAIRGDLIDDCALARSIKRNGPVWLGLTARSRSIRAYGRLAGLWRMVARTAFHQLRYSASLLAATVVALLVVYLGPPLVLLAWPLHGDAAAALLGALALLAMCIAYLPTVRLYGGGPFETLLLPLAALFYAAMTLDSARRHWSGRGGAWKARYHRPGEASRRG